MNSNRKNRRDSRARGNQDEKDAKRRLRMYDCMEVGIPDPIPLKMKQANQNLFTFDQTVSLSTIATTAVAGVEVDKAYQFLLSDLDGASNLVAVFDQYRFLQVTVTFQPRISENISGGSGIGTLTTAIDYDDANNLGVAALRQYETVAVVPAYKAVSRTLTPHCAIAVYNGAFSAFANRSMQWIDCAYQSVQHYSVKASLTNSSLVSATMYDVTARYVLQFRNTI